MEVKNPDFYKALVNLQSELRSVVADSTNPHFKSTYASLTGVIEYSRPLLTKYGFFVTQILDETVLSTQLIHTSGEKLVSNYPLPPNQDLGLVQKFGAALSYARRYSLMAILGLGVDDDDGNTASVGAKIGTTAAPPAPSLYSAQRLAGPSTTVAVPVHEDNFILDREPKGMQPLPAPVNNPVANYQPTFGKYKDKKLYQIPTIDLQGYINYLNSSSTPGKPMGKGAVEFIKMATSEIENRARGEALPF